MKDSPAAAPAEPTTAIPVICEQCRATGMSGDEAFAAIPDLLDFEPVPRRAHANGWTPEHQRAFIAALAITGSPRQAARHVGRAAFGAEQLRTAKGGRSFAVAWEAALEVARDRELAYLHGNLGELARKTEEARAQAKAEGSPVPTPGHGDEYEEGARYDREAEEVRERLLSKVRRLRKEKIREQILPFPEKIAAWIVLNGREEIEPLAEEMGVTLPGESAENSESYSRDAKPDRPAGDRASSERNPSGGEAGFTPAQPPSSPEAEGEAGPRVRSL